PATPAPKPAPVAKPKPLRDAKPKAEPEPALQEFKDDFEELARDFSEGGTPATARPKPGGSSTVPMMGSRHAAIVGSTQFPYPRHAAEQEIEGKVEVRISVGPDGGFAGAQVMKSSGYRELDDAVLEAVRSWRYQPAVRTGIPVPGFITRVVNFTHGAVITH
ncbi:MAG: TonB family protein, partial [Methylococcaceae bacterium]|nr:TonB family protein [Methylococcaceae bacterium]